MTPQIALDLSPDGVAVLSRATDGVWWREGVVRLDALDMAEALARLRERCVARAGEDFTSILIIPDGQMLFTSLERDDRDPKVTVRALLEGRTPYAVKDLAFDFAEVGDRLLVAVVARETLLEAEAFAEGLGFRPVALMGNPAADTHPGPVHFGQTRGAPALLAGARLDLDVEDGFDVVPAPAPPPEPETPEAAEDDTAAPATVPMPVPVDEIGDAATFGEVMEATPSVDDPPAPPASPRAGAEAEGEPPDAPPAPPAPSFSTRRTTESPADGTAEAASARSIAPRLTTRTTIAAEPSLAPIAPEPVVTRPEPPRVGPADARDDAVALALPGLARDRATKGKRGGMRLGLYLTLGLLALLALLAVWSVLQGDAPPPEAARSDAIERPVAEARTPVEMPSAAPAPADVAPPAPAEETAALLPEPKTRPEASAPSTIALPPVPPAPEPAPEVPEVVVVERTVPILRAPRPDAAEAEGPAATSPSVPAQADPAPVEPARVAGTEPRVTEPPATRGSEDLDTSRIEADDGPVPGGPEGAIVSESVEAEAVALPPDDAERRALRRLRPIQRPAEATVEGTAEEALPDAVQPPIAAGFTRAELTRVRPRERPAAAVDAAAAEADAERERAAGERAAVVEAAASAAIASLASQAAAGTEAVTVDPVSGLALPVSERPRTRPRTVEREAARIVTTRREQTSAPARQTASASTAETDGEEAAPQAQRSTQTIRSAGGNVARAATQRNAMRLREINVIGIFGRANDRRALVRLSNGRYLRVKVGDRLDRGRVVAIGESQLVYQKGGRNIGLNLPST